MSNELRCIHGRSFIIEKWLTCSTGKRTRPILMSPQLECDESASNDWVNFERKWIWTPWRASVIDDEISGSELQPSQNDSGTNSVFTCVVYTTTCTALDDSENNGIFRSNDICYLVIYIHWSNNDIWLEATCSLFRSAFNA